MKALAIKPGTKGIFIKDIPAPVIHADDEIILKVIDIGICGTDRAEVSGGRADHPEGENDLIIGHEMFGQVVETGRNVTSASAGDYGLFTVRRECGICIPCSLHRSDMCNSGLYTERGIKLRHGFQSEYVVDEEKYFIKVPSEIKSIGVLTEPMSIAEKAIDEAMQIQSARLPGFNKEDWLRNSRALIAGIGSVGLLAAFILAVRGVKIYGLDIVDENSTRPGILKKLGGTYIDGRKISATDIDDACGEMDFIFEATGIAKLEFQLIDALGINGVYSLTGIPEGDSSISITGADIMRQAVLKNQVILGSVNAGINHFKMAVNDLLAAERKWPDLIESIITERVPVNDFEKAFQKHSSEEIKVVINWS